MWCLGENGTGTGDTVALSEDVREIEVIDELGASTPVESSVDVVKITGGTLSGSWKLLRWPIPICPSSAVTRQT